MVKNSDGCVKGSAQQVTNCIRHILKSTDLAQCMYSSSLLLLSGHQAWRDGMPTVPRCLCWHPSPQNWHLGETPGEEE